MDLCVANTGGSFEDCEALIANAYATEWADVYKDSLHEVENLFEVNKHVAKYVVHAANALPNDAWIEMQSRDQFANEDQGLWRRRVCSTYGSI